MYSSTIQSFSLTISLNIAKGRLLHQVSRMLQTSSFNFQFEVESYPPAVYYPPSVNNTYHSLGIFLHLLCGITLAFSVIGFAGIKKTVFYSMELFNFMVILYIIEGMGLVNYSDWVVYCINIMKTYTLVGGFSVGMCQCMANPTQYSYGYCDQLFENAGIVMVIDAVILAVLLVIYGICRANNANKNIKTKLETSWIDKAWIFGKYYVLAFLLVFNANVMFSSFLMLLNVSSTSSPLIANVIFASVVIVLGVTLFVFLFLWTK